MRKNKKLVKMLAAVLALSTVASGANGFARSSKRAAWNDASSTKDTASTVTDACFVEDGSETDAHLVYANVYADSTRWNNFKSEWEAIKNNYEQAALSPGASETELNFAWYSKRKETPMVKWMSEDGKTIRIFEGTQRQENAEDVKEGEEETLLYPNKVTVTGLTEHTKYKYQYLVDGKWSEAYTYSTEEFSSFRVLYVGDPQIGASVGQDSNNAEYHAMNDSYNWNNTIQNATKQNEDLSFILSAGDQINQTSVGTDAQKLEQQIEYAGFLSPEELRSVPIATTIGNHDSKSKNYQNHFNNANAANTEDTTTGKTAAGTDYYFRHGNTLFVIIDTNNYNCTTHENLIREAVEKNGDATWKILMFHQDIYGSGYDHSDSDGMILRTTLTPIIDRYGFDAVLQGHDHTYSRTYQISADASVSKQYTASDYLENGQPSAQYLSDNANCYDLLTKKEEANKVINPEGTVYFEANSATGSKYYQLIGTQQDYIAARSQSYRPTYSVLDINDVSLTVKTYDAATGKELVADGGVDTSYTIVKSADKTTLSAKIKEAEEVLKKAEKEQKYTADSIKKLSNVLKEARKVEENKEATSKDTASAAVSLQEAMDGLVKKKVQTLSGKTSYEVTYKKDKKITLDTKVQEKGAVLTYTSSNTKAAVVDKKGVVTLTGPGETVITVTASATDASLAASRKVTIRVLPETVVKLEAGQTTEKITLSWKKAKGVSGYMIYQYNKDTKKYKVVKTVKGEGTTSTAIKGLKDGTEYSYAVKAYKTSAGNTLKSSSYSKRVTTATKPAAVSKVKAVAGKKRMTITYSKVTRGSGYEIVYSHKASFSKASTKTYRVTNRKITKASVKKLAAKKTYYVKVRAYKQVEGKRIYGSFSKTIKVKVR